MVQDDYTSGPSGNQSRLITPTSEKKGHITYVVSVDPALYPTHQFPDVETLNTAKGFLAKAAANKAVPFWIGVGFVRPKSPPADSHTVLHGAC